VARRRACDRALAPPAPRPAPGRPALRAPPPGPVAAGSPAPRLRLSILAGGARAWSSGAPRRSTARAPPQQVRLAAPGAVEPRAGARAHRGWVDGQQRSQPARLVGLHVAMGGDVIKCAYCGPVYRHVLKYRYNRTHLWGRADRGPHLMTLPPMASLQPERRSEAAQRLATGGPWSH
jgi:hypothetical protein